MSILQNSFDPFPELITDRLILQYPTDEWVLEFFNMYNDQINNKFLERSPFLNIEEAHQKLAKLRLGIIEKKSLYWIIKDKSSEFIGSICLWNYDLASKNAELGYELASNKVGKGYMSEAIRAVENFAWETQELNVVTAFTNQENIKSSALLKKNGFIFQNTRKEELSGAVTPCLIEVYKKERPSANIHD